MTCEVLEVIITREQEDGGIPCGLGFGPPCQVRLVRHQTGPAGKWWIIKAVPCEQHARELTDHARELLKQ